MSPNSWIRLWLVMLATFLDVQHLMADYRLEVTAHAYSNPDGITSAGYCCDYRYSSENRPPNCGIRQDHCDTGFTFCLRSHGTQHDGNPVNCPLGRYETRQHVGADYITFNRQFIESPNVPNPLTFTGTTWLGAVQLYIEAEDRDSSSNDQLIDDIYAEVTLTPGHSLHQRSYQGSFNRASISLTFNLTCTGSFGGPNCTRTDHCEQLSNPANGQVQQPTTIVEGSLAIYTCNSGYILNGVSTRTCRSRTWTNTAPVCTLRQFIDCGVPSRPLNGGTSYTSTTFQSQVTYTCVSGYFLQGPSTRWCQSDGTWSDYDPQCIRVNTHCRNLDDPPNGRVSIADGVARYTCNYGYMLSGGLSVQTCLETGQWSSTAPTCIVVDCGSPQRPQNGGTLFTSTTFQSQVTYTCASGFTLQGPSIRTCQSDGLWSGHNPVCNSKASEPEDSVTVASDDQSGKSVSIVEIFVILLVLLLLFSVIGLVVSYVSRKIYKIHRSARTSPDPSAQDTYNVNNTSIVKL